MKRTAQKMVQHSTSRNNSPIDKAFGIWKRIKDIDGVSYVRRIRDGANKRTLRLKIHG